MWNAWGTSALLLCCLSAERASARSRAKTKYAGDDVGGQDAADGDAASPAHDFGEDAVVRDLEDLELMLGVVADDDEPDA